MTIYVNAKAGRNGNGTKEMPFRRINDAAKIAKAGDEVLVYPGIYREYVNPINAGTEDARITYRSVEPLGAVITGAEQLKSWVPYEGDVWVCRVKNSIFGDYNPYTTFIYGDWYFAKANKHSGCVYLNDKALYEAETLADCIKAEVYEYSWVPEDSLYKWYTEQDAEADETVIYANFRGADPNVENVEINVRRMCFFPKETGVSYITVSGFNINKAATTWAPPAAFQDAMIGPHWSKGWIIEDCDISNSKCSGIGLGKYYDPDNNHYFTTKYVKSPTQMERDAVCRGQYHGWLKEKVGSHIIRRNNIHHCEQGGIIGRMGGVFSIIEDNHIHHINNMMELGGAEIAGIKMHAAIDVTMRRNHIHHCTMGIWCDWEAQGTRISGNLLHDNQRPEFAKALPGGMMSQDLFVEVSHGPTLIDHNILLSDASLRIATQGVAMVHNLICGSLTEVGSGTGWRYTPYHIPHRTEVMGFMTFLHGDDRFYNNIFVQKWPTPATVAPGAFGEGPAPENRVVGTWLFDEYPSFDEWNSQFDFSKPANMMELEKVHFGHLPVWSEGNVYLAGAKAWSKDVNALVVDNTPADVKVELVEKDGKYYLDTNVYDFLGGFGGRMINTEVLGKAFEPEQYFENPDGTPIQFDSDYFGDHRGTEVIPGPFACAEAWKTREV
ncbi:MAG: right-handed parallel beta-helix repeat-containing protein [Oscillospiraceae bacterium]|nr:right-handed parallel beta-helix repeat-containing protein [Oscillospiraceae bacterium]